jgi:uncharacterized protein
MEPVEVVGVRMEMPSNTPIVLLKQLQGSLYVPIWIGAVEATSIAFAHQGVVPPRPLTHDFMLTSLHALGTDVDHVEITQLLDGVYYATVHFTQGATVDARPSDAIALAIRAQVPILVAPEVIAEAGIELPDEAPAEEEVERFRAFLDDVSPEDFIEPS